MRKFWHWESCFALASGSWLLPFCFFIADARILEDIQIVFLLWSVGLRDFKGHIARLNLVIPGLSLAFPGFIVMMQIAGPADTALANIEVVWREWFRTDSADWVSLHV
jgi:hypothetical protein